MFRNLRISIFIYYFLTVTTFLAVFYYFLEIVKVDNLVVVVIFLVCFIILSGIFISKLSIDPLVDYVHNLQALSKETLHELNLPISTIKSNTQMLKKNVDDEKIIKRVKRIENACEMLELRYNELDYMIKMQTKQEIKEQFFLNDLVKERVDFLQKLYPNFVFHLDLDPMELYSDKRGLAKVIDNIIDNGVKYSLDSKIIEISLRNKTLSIRDFGIGMDEVQLLQIFDNYYQANKDMQGFGIGLSMVKRYCDTNNIELVFDSQKGVGTTVKLQFK